MKTPGKVLNFIEADLSQKESKYSLGYVLNIITNAYGYNDTVFYDTSENYIVDQIISVQKVTMDNYNLFISNTEELICNGFSFRYNKNIF